MVDVEASDQPTTRPWRDAETRPIGKGSDARARPQRGPGDVVGSYTLRERLGAGGMGVVFAAHDARLDREVALKLLRPSFGSRRSASTEDRNRLRREAQAMAQLAHPNVVEIFDVGADGDDVYIAMARIRGQSLRRWLAEFERPWREIVAVFVQAGQGLAAAHAAELVHRDFKPSNVLVDREGRVRVLDFGLAVPTLARRSRASGSGSRLVGASSIPDSSTSDRISAPLTEAGVVLGTPSYMAPEQYRGEQVGPSADQYSFCVALYEGLYGTRVFQGKKSTALLRAKEEEPVLVKPGRKIPHALHLLLVRGLAPAAEDRWPSMETLLVELEQLSRPRRRWPWVVGLAGAIAVAGSLGAGLGDSEVDLECAEANARRAATWGPSSHAAVRAALIADKGAYGVDTADRVERRLDDYTARWDALHESICSAGSRSVEAGSLQERQRACLGRRLRRLETVVDLLGHDESGLRARAVSLVRGLPALDRCGETSPEDDGLPTPDDPELAARVQELHAELEVVQTWLDAGLYDKAHKGSLAVHEKAQTLGYAPLVDLAGFQLGTSLSRQGEYEAAEAQLVETLHRAEAAGRDRLAVKVATRLVVLVGSRLGRYEDGLRWGKHALSMVSRLEGDRRPEAYLRVHVGGVLVGAGRLEEGTLELRAAVSLWTELAGADGTEVAGARNNLGSALFYLGRYEDAIAEYEEVLRIQEQAWGPLHPEIGKVLTNSSQAWSKLGEHEKAERLRRRVLEIWLESLGEDHPEMYGALLNLGLSARTLGHYDEAIRLFERAHGIAERTMASDHPDLGMALANLGQVHRDEGRDDRALEYSRRARGIFERNLGDHEMTATSIVAIGDVLMDQGTPEAAVVEFEAALAMLIRVRGPEHPDLAYIHLRRGQALAALDRLEQARTQFERGLVVLGERGILLDVVAETRFDLAKVLRRQGQAPARAQRLAEQAREQWQSRFEPLVDEVAEVTAWLADAP